MDKLEADIRRGLEAKRILEHDIVKEAHDHIEAELWRMFKDTTPQDAKTLEFVKAMQYFHGKYWDFMKQVVINGKLAQINLEAKKKSLRERMFG
jgi:hypothetical protein